MANTMYNAAHDQAYRGNVNWVSATASDFQALLLTTLGTISKTHATIAAIIAAGSVEATGAVFSGYARQNILNRTLVTSGSNLVQFQSDPIDYGVLGAGGGGQLVRGIIIYRNLGSDATSFPLWWYDIGVNIPGAPDGVNAFTITPNANGWQDVGQA